MTKLLYYFLLLVTVLLLYNWFFIPSKIMSNGRSEKEGFGTVTVVSCLLSIVVGYLYYSGHNRWANWTVYLIYLVGLILLLYVMSNARWN